MKIVLSNDEVMEYVKNELEKNFTVESVEFDENDYKVYAEVQPKKQSPYEEKNAQPKKKHQPGDHTKPRFSEGRDTMSTDKGTRDKNMRVF